MLGRGATVREVCRAVGVAKETVQRRQKWGKLWDIKYAGKTRVNTGRRKDGSISFYYTSEPREHWLNQHLGDGTL